MASLASELTTVSLQQERFGGYGGGGGKGRRYVRQGKGFVSAGMVKKVRLGLVQLRERERDLRVGGGGVAVASAAAAAAASVDVEEGDAEVAALLARRMAIIEEEERSRGFVITEVETTGCQDWHTGTVTAVRDVAAGVRCVTVETEVSRELVSLSNAFMKPGQFAQLRVNDEEIKAVPSSSPFSEKVNAPVLYKIRGDIPAGTTKLPQFSLSVKAPFDIHVQEATTPELYNITEGQALEVGPFTSSGLDLRPILYLSRFPTIVFFAQGSGIAVTRSIVEAIDGDNGSMNLSFRDEVRLFYSANKPSQLAYQDKYALWESKNVKVRTTVDNSSSEEWQGSVGSLSSLWDKDDLEYDPTTTGAIVCVEKETRQEVLDLLEEAGIPKEQIVSWEY